MKKLLIGAVFALSACATAEDLPQGMAKVNASGETVLWDNSSQSWMKVEPFWLKYAEENGGLTWGATDTYPEYEMVKEGDKILIQLQQGNCLMEFFHSRWRRANDVRRWDDKVNEYGGCPYVFN